MYSVSSIMTRLSAVLGWEDAHAANLNTFISAVRELSGVFINVQIRPLPVCPIFHKKRINTGPTLSYSNLIRCQEIALQR